MISCLAALPRLAGGRITAFGCGNIASILPAPSIGRRWITKQLSIILLQDMPKLGNRGQIVKVKPGYFRNFLQSNLIAVYDTPENRVKYVDQSQMQTKVEEAVDGNSDDVLREKLSRFRLVFLREPDPSMQPQPPSGGAYIPTDYASVLRSFRDAEADVKEGEKPVFGWSGTTKSPVTHTMVARHLFDKFVVHMTPRQIFMPCADLEAVAASNAAAGRAVPEQHLPIQEFGEHKVHLKFDGLEGVVPMQLCVVPRSGVVMKRPNKPAKVQLLKKDVLSDASLAEDFQSAPETGDLLISENPEEDIEIDMENVAGHEFDPVPERKSRRNRARH